MQKWVLWLRTESLEIDISACFGFHFVLIGNFIWTMLIEFATCSYYFLFILVILIH